MLPEVEATREGEGAREGEEAPAVPPACRKSASDPEGSFTLAIVVDSAAGTASGGLDNVSATMLSAPGTCRMSAVNSAINASCHCRRSGHATSI